MNEIPDVYCDQFQINLSPYGATLNFSISPAIPPPPGGVVQAERKATVRMSLQHLKLMAFILQRQLKAYERAHGVRIDLPAEVLNGTQIGPEDWAAFWS